MFSKLSDAIVLTKKYYTRDAYPWVVGFSGGKDSSLVVKILLHAISLLPDSSRKPITIIYCDTGVEIPVLRGYISETLANIKREGLQLGIEIDVEVASPRLTDHFFVKVIGRGYPPPSNKFRWCTDRLRIEPIQRALKSIGGQQHFSYVALGTRYEESIERNRVLLRNSTEEKNIFTQTNYPATMIYSPIADFSINEVWEGILGITTVSSIDIKELSNIYRLISGECPIVRLPDMTPCSSGRFGCWTCTVVRNDKASLNLIENGYTALRPLYEFRSWLLSIRNNQTYRCTIRRNGAAGLGPFRLSARKEIMEKLVNAQRVSGYCLISSEEVGEIEKLWEIDALSDRYREDL